LRLFWRRLRRDRAALISAGAVAFILFALFAGPEIAQPLLGHGPNDLFPYAVDGNLKPTGPWSEVPDVHIARADPETDVTLPPEVGASSTLLVFGADGGLGRDEFLRLLVGGRNSLTVALLATLLSLTLGVLTEEWPPITGAGSTELSRV
jgi:peptide/nickel transport system permease protein